MLIRDGNVLKGQVEEHEEWEIVSKSSSVYAKTIEVDGGGTPWIIADDGRVYRF